MIQQWFDNDCLIIQLAWLIFRQWFNVTLIIHSSSQSSSINLLAWLFIRVIDYSTMIRQWLFYQPAQVMDYSTMIESHWLVVINPPTHQNWLFVRVVNRAQATNPHDWLFVWLIIHQWFDNDCLINHLAWLIIWQWLSHIDYSGLIKKLIKLIIRVVNRVQSTKAHDWFFAWLIIQQWFINALLIIRVTYYSTMTDCHIEYSFE